jgi:hypothetical protein
MKPLNRWTFADIIAFVKSVDKKTWLTVLAGGAGFLLLVIFLIVPAWIERPLLRRDIQSMEAQIRQVKALSQKRAGWEETQKVFGSLIEETQKRVFTENDMGLLLGQASKFAAESRVDVLASKPLGEKMVFPAPYNLKYQPSGYEFTMQGSYHDLGMLVSRIENHEKLLRIQRLEIVPDKKVLDRHVADLKLLAILKAPPPAAVSTKATKAKNAKK